MKFRCVGDATHGNNDDMVTEETGLCRTEARSGEGCKEFLDVSCQLAVAE